MINVLFSFYQNINVAMKNNSFKIFVLFLALLLYSATGYMYFELPQNPDLKWADCFWWAIVTMTTVGYGDFFPTNIWGRFLVGFPTMLLGIGLLGYMLSLVATTILEDKLMERKGMKQLTLVDHIIICNYCSLDKILKLINELRRDLSTESSHIVVVDKAIDELPSELQGEYIHFIKGDPAREAVLEKASISTSKAVMIQANMADPFSSDDHNLRIMLTIESLSSSTFSVVECVDPENVIFFRRANTDSVVCIASLTGQMLVQELQDPGVGDIVAELTSNAHGRQLYVVDIKDTSTNYKNLQDSYTNNNGILLGIRRGKENHIMPKSDFTIEDGDKAVVIAKGRPSVI